MALIGLLVGLAGFSLSCYSYLWQKHTYQENQEERILIRLNTWHTFRNPQFKIVGIELPLLFDPGGKLGIEVVNIGMRPMYLKKVHGQLERQPYSFYDYDPLKPDATLRKLEAGEPVNYTVDVDFSQPINKNLEERTLDILVETTKKTFEQKARVSSSLVSGLVSAGKISH
jgi:hypothetical protein